MGSRGLMKESLPMRESYMPRVLRAGAPVQIGLGRDIAGSMSSDGEMKEEVELEFAGGIPSEDGKGWYQ